MFNFHNLFCKILLELSISVNFLLDIWNYAFCCKTEKVLRTSFITFSDLSITVSKIRNFVFDLRILVALHWNTETLFWRKFALKAFHRYNFLESFIVVIFKRAFLDWAYRLFNWWIWVVTHYFMIILFDDNESLLMRILWFFNFIFMRIHTFFSNHRFMFLNLCSYRSFFNSLILHCFKYLIIFFHEKFFY